VRIRSSALRRLSSLVPLIEFDHVARRVDHDRLIPEPLPVLLVVNGVSVIADARDGRRKVVNFDREMRRVHCRVRRLEEVYLPVAYLKPRAGIVRAIGSIDNRQTEYVSIERQGRIGVVHDERNMVNTSTTRFRHDRIMPVLVRGVHAEGSPPRLTVRLIQGCCLALNGAPNGSSALREDTQNDGELGERPDDRTRDMRSPTLSGSYRL
jgi:hypothetical protein